jgi:hypothetical protein
MAEDSGDHSVFSITPARSQGKMNVNQEDGNDENWNSKRN